MHGIHILAMHLVSSLTSTLPRSKLNELRLLHDILNDITKPPYLTDLHRVAPKLLASADTTKIARMQGSLVGMAVGDAVGGGYTFVPKDMVVASGNVDMIGGGHYILKPGQWTNDTSMALCLSSSLIIHGYNNHYDQLLRYLELRDHKYFSSQASNLTVGCEISTVLDNFKMWMSEELDSDELGDRPRWRSPHMQASCQVFGEPSHVDLEKKIQVVQYTRSGSSSSDPLVRLAPIPIFYHGSSAAAIENAAKSARTTHDNAVVVDACKYYTAFVWEAVNGASREELLGMDLIARHKELESLSPEIFEIANGSYRTQDELPGTFGYGNETAQNALKAALWALYNDEGSFERGVNLATKLAGNSNTTSALYGTLAGALYGHGAIPEKWTSALLAHEFIRDIATLLSVRGSSSEGGDGNCNMPTTVIITTDHEAEAVNTEDGVNRNRWIYVIWILLLLLVIFAVVGIVRLILN